MDKITPCLWFDGQAEDAAEFYAATIPNSRIVNVERSPADTPSGAKGSVLTVEFELAGRSFLGLNGGPEFKFDEAVSFQVYCDDQAEVDRLWTALTANGGEPSVCGWLKDRFGLSWQVIPRRMPELFAGSDRAGAERAMKAMLDMTKIEIAELEAAYEGRGVGVG